MALYALDDLGDAYAATRAFLFPFDWGRWLRLALVAFFVASATGMPTSGFQFGGTGGGVDPGADGDVTPAEFDAAIQELAPLVSYIVVAVVVGLLLALAFAFVGSVMEFVLVESLREDRVAVREFFGQYAGEGARLFGFRVALGLLGLLGAALTFGLTVGPLLVGGSPSIPLASLAVLGPLFVLFALALAVVNGFTTVFVVPVMLLEDRGVLSAGGRLWPTIRGQWRQFGAYALVVAAVLFALGIAASIAVAIPVALVAVAFAVLAGVGGLAGGVTPAMGVVLALLAIPFVLVVFAVVALVQVPIQTYVRYHALLVLGDADERFDLIPDTRRSLREPGQGEVPGPTGAD